MNRSSFLTSVAAQLQAKFPLSDEQKKLQEVKRALELEAMRLAQGTVWSDNPCVGEIRSTWTDSQDEGPSTFRSRLLEVRATESKQVRKDGLRFAPRAFQPHHSQGLASKLQYRVLCLCVAMGAQLHSGLGVGIGRLQNMRENTRSHLLQKVLSLVLKPLVYLGGSLTQFVIFCGHRACLLLHRDE